MPDFSQFIKLFNTYLPLPTEGNNNNNTQNNNTNATSTVENLSKTADSTWRLLTTNDPTSGKEAKSNALANFRNNNNTENNNNTKKETPKTTNNNNNNNNKITPPVITIGAVQLSKEDRWRIQATLRREESKVGLARREYNKKVTRAVLVTKGPSANPADAFPPGRGRPV
ncbi:hypothetical protein AGDE_08584 [Angomonas deanei]|nr:hypothetical protein AGDE_09054 [Angomonas deanei]EPY32549.1 hypothetical protein AGDE_08584 [Angomonas deanei]|eukprot:EPY31434.1 hypothetical protein AGDE_09054 [Angomonas deanei]